MVTKEWAKANSSDTGFFEFLTSSLVLVIRHVFHFTSKMFFFSMGDDLSYGLNTLGPLCLWQCLIKPRQRKALIQTHVNVVVLDKSKNRTKVPWIQSTRMSACQRLCWDSPDILGALCSPIDSIAVSLFTNSCHIWRLETLCKNKKV